MLVCVHWLCYCLSEWRKRKTNLPTLFGKISDVVEGGEHLLIAAWGLFLNEISKSDIFATATTRKINHDKKRVDGNGNKALIPSISYLDVSPSEEFACDFETLKNCLFFQVQKL